MVDGDCGDDAGDDDEDGDGDDGEESGGEGQGGQGPQEASAQARGDDGGDCARINP